ncbi:MAG: hypothetical protein HC779_01155 [Phyllobacteriaceae bacterium]|nr:hypothetical protein [Phyllobacteriaceae bacterium]
MRFIELVTSDALDGRRLISAVVPSDQAESVLTHLADQFKDQEVFRAAMVEVLAIVPEPEADSDEAKKLGAEKLEAPLALTRMGGLRGFLAASLFDAKYREGITVDAGVNTSLVGKQGRGDPERDPAQRGDARPRREQLLASGEPHDRELRRPADEHAGAVDRA